MSEQPKRIVIESINPKIREFYHKHNLDYVPTAEDRAHGIFDMKLVGETKSWIGTIYRIRLGTLGKKSEYLFYWEAVNGHDRLGNKIQKRFIRGKLEMPQPDMRFDEGKQRPVCVGIQSFETEYDIPFSKELLDEMVADGRIDERTCYAFSYNGTNYSVKDFDDFRNLSIEDLLYIGRTGLRPEAREEQAKLVGKKA